MQFYTTTSGHRIEYEPSAKVAAFLRRIEEAVNDREITSQQLIGIAYSTENPFLDHNMFPGRGGVTRAVLENPAYEVLTDLLFRKQLAESGTPIEKVAAKYSLTVREAAAQLGITEGAVRQAIAAKRIASWLKNGQHFLNPKALTSLEVGKRAPIGPRAPRTGAPLAVFVGQGSEGRMMNLRTTEAIANLEKSPPNTHKGEVHNWRRVVVRTFQEGSGKRAFVLEPSDEENVLNFEPFYVRGRFSVVEKANESSKAEELWKSTVVA